MTPSQQIDKLIADLSDWRGELLTQIRKIINESEPNLDEKFKWGTGMWSLNGKLVCGFGAFKEHVKINFFKGALLANTHKAFNNGFESKNSRSIDIRKDEILNQTALKELVHAAVNFAK